MAVLTTKKRNSLKASTFGEPKSRKYPMPDKAHAVNAKARATQMVKKGKLSKSTESKIDAKANKIIGKKRGRPSMKHKEGSVYEEKHESKGEKKAEIKAGLAYKKLQEKHEKLKEKHNKMKEDHKENLLLLKQKHKAKLLVK